MKLYCYSNPNMMNGYKRIFNPSEEGCYAYTDDVAICYAESLKEAIDKFAVLYRHELLEGKVKEVDFENTLMGVYICTDY